MHQGLPSPLSAHTVLIIPVEVDHVASSQGESGTEARSLAWREQGPVIAMTVQLQVAKSVAQMPDVMSHSPTTRVPRTRFVANQLYPVAVDAEVGSGRVVPRS